MAPHAQTRRVPPLPPSPTPPHRPQPKRPRPLVGVVTGTCGRRGRRPPHPPPRPLAPRCCRHGRPPLPPPVSSSCQPPPAGPHPRAPPRRRAGVVYTPTAAATASRPCPRFFFVLFCAWPGGVGTDRPTRPPGRGPSPCWWCGQRPRRVVRATAVTPLDDCRRHPARPLVRAGRWPPPSNRRPLPPRDAPLPRRAVRLPVGDRLSSSRASATVPPAPRTSSPRAVRCCDLVCLSDL